MKDFASERADLPVQLAPALVERLASEGLTEVWERFERPLIPVLVAIERAGVSIDGPALAAQSERFVRELDALSRRIFELAGTEFNIASPKQLGEVLFEKMQLPVLKRTGRAHDLDGGRRARGIGADTRDAEAGARVARTVELKGTYIDALPQLVNRTTGRVHTSFNQAVAATGRLSSSDPNLQNIPIRLELGREIRRSSPSRDTP